MSAPGLSIHDSEEAVARAAAGRVVGLARAIPANRRFRIGLSGGRTPRRLYQLLATRLEADRVELLFADERAVPPDSEDSNYRLVQETLLAALPVPAERVHRMRGELADLEVAAREYEPLLEPPLDLLVLGIGEDGHVASLFPGSPLIEERSRRVAAVLDSPKPPARRLTITPRVIVEAGTVMVLAIGAAKAGAVAAALAVAGDPADCPARLARGGEWLLDRAAAEKANARG